MEVTDLPVSQITITKYPINNHRRQNDTMTILYECISLGSNELADALYSLGYISDGLNIALRNINNTIYQNIVITVVESPTTLEITGWGQSTGLSSGEIAAIIICLIVGGALTTFLIYAMYK